MIYPQNFEQKTGFDKVRRLISDKCLSPLGQERVAEMEFSADYTTVIERLEQTDEFVRILHGEVEFPASFFFDVRYSLKRIRPEGTWLDEKELFDLKRSLQTINDIVRFFRTEEDEEIAYPALTALAGDILVFPQLIGKIDSILDKFGKVKDNASPTLAQIRKEISSTMSGISRSLQSILRNAQSEGVVDKDVTPTMRDGRLMIPVAPAFKRKIKGIVHDESASGKTVFIEPEVVVEANNRVRELEGDERREIMKILTEFTNIVRPMVPDILQSYEFMADIDFIRAKALFAEQVKGIKPVVENVQQVDWARAVHPLLYLSLQKQNKQVIPLDITLDEKKRILIISGPNAGGKSVCLKTVGLLQYMMQCGLLIPLHESSRTGIFSSIFIDIGDEQSIENDLSTYSSHLTNMKYFVRNCNEKTIILIDEFGSGTEPQIGGAIAEALLDRFNRNRSFGVITTHYQNLKHFAEDTEGIVNGAMLYDRHLMQPLFKLSIGNPGSSFAVEIARKIGLPEDVIADASAKVGSDYIDMDKYLQDIVRDKRYWESKRQKIRQQEKKLEDITSRYEKDLEEVNRQRKEIMREAKAEAQRILAEANARIENTVREIKEAQAEKEQTKLARKALEEFKASVESAGEEDDKIARKMAKLQERKERKKQKQNTPAAKQTFNRDVIEVGDNVRLKGQVSAGTVMELQGKQAVVAFGMIKSTLKLEQLEKVSKGQIKKEIQKSTFVSSDTTDHMHEKKLNFKQEIDVRGMRGDEALQTVTYFIDDAIQVGASRVRILHGTGTGILRQLIRDYLHSVPGVRHYHDEHVQLGGAGITVVELD
ncbi:MULTISPECIES: endonuclease MutS2 [Parabacteroides]|uniref:Endonuclease MutS2 n=6 Tax=Parabacteroides goldsteinii TaxID=328812 RepID=A0A6G1ZK93_9BACT|nr:MULTISPECIES: endonuclease MutS2 [Parabacteroides]EOS18743.1 MutS2 family protein [Parabacteroides goldsteinii dnLKV18]KAI4361498.1 Endonuclease MutS2 [Parabacteroides sp. ASF519]MBF0767619.1 endonuclease MutS2 [Parabacteroides goldsteinii]MDZ3930019.1 endonuclease MutS2 [Parabacteroides goldsteinii]MRX94793.1 endonuclease MutS2 [Parabacteroides goldsteinii]